MRFKVVGSHAVDGVDPGGTVVIDDERRARTLVRAGHLEPKTAPKKTKTEEVPDGDPGLD